MVAYGLALIKFLYLDKSELIDSLCPFRHPYCSFTSSSSAFISLDFSNYKTHCPHPPLHFPCQITCILPSVFTLFPASSVFTSLPLPRKLSLILPFVQYHLLLPSLVLLIPHPQPRQPSHLTFLISIAKYRLCTHI